VAALLVGTATAIVVTQHLRDDGPVASSIHFKTKPDRYRACFRLTRSDTVEVSMVDASDRVVRVLAAPETLAGGDAPHCFDWDGRDASGRPVPPGPYRLQLHLAQADRTATSGEKLSISKAPPP